MLLAAAAAFYIAPSDRYIFLPDDARPLEPRVEVEGEKPDRNGGGIYYVAVDVRKASLLEKAFPGSSRERRWSRRPTCWRRGRTNSHAAAASPP